MKQAPTLLQSHLAAIISPMRARLQGKIDPAANCDLSDLRCAMYIPHERLLNRSIDVLGVGHVVRVWQELYTNQVASLVDFDSDGFSATVKFYSEDVEDGSMTTYLTRGMVRTTAVLVEFDLVSKTILVLINSKTKIIKGTALLVYILSSIKVYD